MSLVKCVKYIYKINNKFTRTTSLALFGCLCCLHLTYFTPFSTVSRVDFEQVNIFWDIGLNIFHAILKVLNFFYIFRCDLRKLKNLNQIFFFTLSREINFWCLNLFLTNVPIICTLFSGDYRKRRKNWV